MSKKIICIILAITFAVSLSAALAASGKNTLEMGKNKLIYKPKFIDGRELSRLLEAYIGVKPPELWVKYISGLNTIVITAPKESHPIIMNIIKEYDKEPQRLEADFYIFKSGDTKSTSPLTPEPIDKNLKSILAELKKHSPSKAFISIGKASLPLKTSGTSREFELGLFHNSSKIRYEIGAKNINVINNMVQITRFRLLRREKLSSEKWGQSEIFRHDLEIKIGDVITMSSSNCAAKNAEDIIVIIWVRNI